MALRRVDTCFRHARWVAAPLVAAGLATATAAQTPGPVRFTEAREHELIRTVHLPGSVESRTTSVVASEVAGRVVTVEAQEGDAVREDQPLVRLRRDWYELQLDEAQGRLQEARARQELAASRLARTRELAADEVVSQQDLDDAVSEFTAWQARVVQSQAEIASLELSLERLVVRAPFDGVVVRKLTDVGQWVELGGDVAEMVELRALDVRVEVPERYFGGLRVGVRSAVRFEALEGLEVSGRLDAIIPRADPRARTFPVKVSVPNADGRIGVGMLADVELPVGSSYRALIVPKDSVLRQGPREVVYRIADGDTVEPVAVRTGPGAGSWVVVEDGPLEPGDRVITRGNERLQPGQPVQGSALEYPLP